MHSDIYSMYNEAGSDFDLAVYLYNYNMHVTCYFTVSLGVASNTDQISKINHNYCFHFLVEAVISKWQVRNTTNRNLKCRLSFFYLLQSASGRFTSESKGQEYFAAQKEENVLCCYLTWIAAVSFACDHTWHAELNQM